MTNPARLGAARLGNRRRSWPRLILAGVLLFALWYTWPAAVSPEFAEVAREHVARNNPGIELGPAIQQTGRFGKYDVRLSGNRDGQTATILVSLEMTADGPRVIKTSTILGDYNGVPLRIAQMVMVIAFVITVFFWAIPQTFGRRCPRDGSLLRYGERSVFPPRYGVKLMTLAAIIQRTWSCPKCDFRHEEACPDPNHRPAMLVSSAFAGVPHIRMADSVETIIEERRRDALARAITDEQYAKDLDEARKTAAGITSPDSPWRR